MKLELSKARARGSRIAQTEGGLTKRELEVLRLFARGLSGRAVARRLSISYTTARNHAQQILIKLGVHSRLAAVVHGYARGLIARPDGGQSSET